MLNSVSPVLLLNLPNPFVISCILFAYACGSAHASNIIPSGSLCIAARPPSTWKPADFVISSSIPPPCISSIIPLRLPRLKRVCCAHLAICISSLVPPLKLYFCANFKLFTKSFVYFLPLRPILFTSFNTSSNISTLSAMP